MGAAGPTESSAFALRVATALTALAGPDWDRRHLLVAVSGGLDSTLLLHVLRELGPATPLSVVHFDHGLHPDSAAWAAHCRGMAGKLAADYVERRLALDIGAGDSVEALAREARYAALAGIAGDGDIVLTAHHADDQLETVLLRLLRGTGVRGLMAIHAASRSGPALLARPLLGFRRAEIEAEARRRGLVWLEDPSNADPRFDRNFLRTESLPPLLRRWPAAALAAGRLARQMAEADGLLGELAAADLGASAASGPIPLDALAGRSAARIGNAVRYALIRRALPLPSAAQLSELQKAFAARGDAAPLVCWPGVEARVFRRQLYLLPAATASLDVTTGDAARRCLDPAQVCGLADGELRLVPSADAGIPDRWARDGLSVRFRRGGERFRPAGHRRHKTLKHWFQETGIVPWMRDRVPLLYRGEELIAIADLCLSDDLPATAADAPFWRPAWTGHSPLH